MIPNNSILLSAYACEPNKGSESEVGWSYLLEASKSYKLVHLITRNNNKKALISELKRLNISNVVIHTFDFNQLILFLKRKFGLIRLYAYFWEFGIFFHLIKKFSYKSFDFSQRVNFVSSSYPSFLYYFSKKFYMGPVCGGEKYPLRLISSFRIKNQLVEVLRIISKITIFLDPFFLTSCIVANKIIVVNKDTFNFFSFLFRHKLIIQSAILKTTFRYDSNKHKLITKTKMPRKIRLVFIGRMIEWKGLPFIFNALQYLDKDKYILNVYGNGPDEIYYKKFTRKNNLNVVFNDRINREDLASIYLNSDLLIHPSLRDSGGMVIVEAKKFGLKCVVSDYGANKDYVDKNDYIIKHHDPKSFVTFIKNIIKDEYKKINKI